MEYIDDTFLCSRCGEEFKEGEATHFDGGIFCEMCLLDFTGVCNDCGERVWQGDIHSDATYTLCQARNNATIGRSQVRKKQSVIRVHLNSLS